MTTLRVAVDGVLPALRGRSRRHHVVTQRRRRTYLQAWSRNDAGFV
jgi:hypothetical protein